MFIVFYATMFFLLCKTVHCVNKGHRKCAAGHSSSTAGVDNDKTTCLGVLIASFARSANKVHVSNLTVTHC